MPKRDKRQARKDALAGKTSPAEALQPTPGDAKHYLRLAAAMLQEQDFEGAEAAAEVAAHGDPQRHQAWVVLAIARVKRKNVSGAVPCFLNALKLRPNDIATWTDLAEAYVVLLAYDKAAQALKRAMELDPSAEHPAGRRARALLARTIKKLKTKAP